MHSPTALLVVLQLLVVCAIRGDAVLQWHGNWALNCDWAGNDMHDVQCATGAECVERCKTTRDCTHYTWRKSARMCFLKHGRVTKKDAHAHPSDDLICGLLDEYFKGLAWSRDSYAEWASGCDFDGNTFKIGLEMSRGITEAKIEYEH